MHQNEIYIKALETWGKEAQTDKAIEEMAELTNELVKYKQGRSSIESIVDEITDVEITVSQMKWLFGYEQCETHKIIKLEKLKRRIENARRKKND